MSRDVMNPSGMAALFSRPERPNHSVLSVYLDVDQSRQANLNRGFENQVKDLISSIRSSIHDETALERFKHAAHHITDFVSAYEPSARGLVLFVVRPAKMTAPHPRRVTQQLVPRRLRPLSDAL